MCHIFSRHVHAFIFLLSEYLGVEFLEHVVGVYLTLHFLFFLVVFFVDSLGFYAQIIMLSMTKDRFMSFFSNCAFLFVSFFLLLFYTS